MDIDPKRVVLGPDGLPDINAFFDSSRRQWACTSHIQRRPRCMKCSQHPMRPASRSRRPRLRPRPPRPPARTRRCANGSPSPSVLTRSLSFTPERVCPASYLRIAMRRLSTLGYCGNSGSTSAAICCAIHHQACPRRRRTQHAEVACKVSHRLCLCITCSCG